MNAESQTKNSQSKVVQKELAQNKTAQSAKKSAANSQAAAVPRQELVQAESHLLQSIAGALPAKDTQLINVMRASLDIFLSRKRLPAANKLVTMQLIEEIVNNEKGKAAMDKSQRLQLAMSLIKNIASPVVNISQVGKTCTVAAYETRIATIYPELYASLIMQVVLKGKYTLADGSEIIYPPNSFANDSTEYKANIASRIFQVTAANVAWQKTTVRPDKLAADLGALRYELAEKKELLKDYTHDKAKGRPVFYDDGTRVECPALTNEQLSLIDRMITGENCVFLISEKWARLPAQSGTFNYKSADELDKFLDYTETGKLPGVRFPLLIGIDGDLLQDGIAKNPAERKKPRSTHIATIMGYDSKTRKLELNNTWNYKFDFVGDKALTSAELWQYLPPPRD